MKTTAYLGFIKDLQLDLLRFVLLPLYGGYKIWSFILTLKSAFYKMSVLDPILYSTELHTIKIKG